MNPTVLRLALGFASSSLVALGLAANAQSPLEDEVNINTWVFDAAGTPTGTFRIGAGVTTSAISSPAGVTVHASDGSDVLLPGTNADSEVMVNRVRASLPTPLYAPEMSVVSLSQALADADAPTLPGLSLVPAPGTYLTTVLVTVSAVPAPSGVGSLALYVAVDSDPEVLVVGTTFTTTFVADGAHTIVARALHGTAESTRTGTWTLTGGNAQKRDSDGDGVPDVVEVEHGTDPFRDDTHDDSDGDGWSDFDELLRGTNSQDANPGDVTAVPVDGDGDGWSDWDEELRGTDPLLPTSKPVAAGIEEVEYTVSGETWQDAAHTLAHGGQGYVLLTDATWRTLAHLSDGSITSLAPDVLGALDPWAILVESYRDMPLATFGTARVPGDGDVIAAARIGNGRNIYKAWITGSPAGTPALIGPRVDNWSGGAHGWVDAYTAELAAHLVQSRDIDLDPESGLATVLCEAAVAWAAGVEAGAPVLLGEPGGARHPEAVDAVAGAFPDIVAFVTAGGFEVVVTRAELAAAIFAPPGDDETTTWAAATRVQYWDDPDGAAALAHFHATLLAFVGWQTAVDFEPYDALPESDPWLPSGDADKDGLSNRDELAGGPDAATNPLYPDTDDDGTGDLADPCPRDPTDGCNEDDLFAEDVDQDGVIDALDNCFGVANARQLDANDDLIGDACEAPARIARPVANIAVLAPGQIELTAMDSAAATGAVAYRWTAGGVELTKTRAATLNIPANAQATDIVVRLFASDADSPEVEVDRRVVRVLVNFGPVPCLAMTCNDGDPCTADACDLQSGCYAMPLSGCDACENSAECDDGNACTTDTCTGDVCVLSKLTGTGCDDGNACSVDDVCDDGHCTAGTALDCDDTDDCTNDSCDAATGCVNEPDPTPDPVLCPECANDGECGTGTCLGGLCCEATAVADGLAHTWNPGDPAPVFCLPAGVELDLYGSVPSGGINFALRDADGTALVATPNSSVKSKRIELESSPASGPHSLTFTTATATVTWIVSISVDGHGAIDEYGPFPVSVDLPTPGSEAHIEFEGVDGEVVSVLGEFATECPFYSLVSPSGVEHLRDNTCGTSLFYGPFELTETGTWEVLIDPGSDGVGEATATVWLVPPEVVTASATDGVARVGSTTVPGQTLSWTFDGTAGQRVSIKSNDPECANHYLYAPSGAQLSFVTSCDNAFSDAISLTETGTYRWFVDPTRMALVDESVTIYLLQPDPELVAVIGGAPVALDFLLPGNNGAVTFEGAVGDVVSITLPESNGMGCGGYYLYAPSGTQLYFVNTCGTAYMDRRTLTEDGTYRVFITPTGLVTGTVTVQVRDVPPDVTGALVIGAAGTPWVVTTPGQNLAPTFVAAGPMSVKIVSTSSGSKSFTVTSSTGAVIFSTNGNKNNNYTSPLFSLPGADTYTLLVDPAGSIVPTVTLAVTP